MSASSQHAALAASAAKLDAVAAQGQVRFSDLLDATPDAIVGIGADGSIELANSQVERIFGYSREELLGRSVDLLVPTLLPAPKAGHRSEYLADLCVGPKSARGDMVARRRDGSEFPVEISLTPLATADGPLVIAAVRDITERAREQAELARLAAAVHSSYDAIISLTPAGVIETWNENAEELYGYLSEEVIGRHVGLLACNPAERAALLSSVAGGSGRAEIESQDIRKDGSLLDVAVTDSPIGDLEGRITGIVRIVRDITERKLAERKVSEAARFFELSSDMVCTAGFDGVFVELNDRWEQTLGWSKDELHSRPFIEFVHSADTERWASEAGRLSAGEAITQFLIRVATKEGGWRWLEWNAIGVPEEELMYASARDVTTRVEAEAVIREAEAEVAAARDAALEASRMKSAFLANMSHEIRTPLNGVIGMADLLLDSPLDVEQQDNARLLKSAGETLVAVVDHLLDFSKIEAGALQLEYVDFDLIEAVEDACDLIAETAHEKGLELTIDLAPDLPELVRGDSVRVGQVISNLLSNAVKFTQQGEISLALRSSPASDGHTQVEFEVTDTGIGVDESRLARVFEPFVQADDSTTRRFGGTGLGLAIVRELVEMMDGQLGAESVPGEGSRFWFTLPLEARETAEPAHPQPALGQAKLLVVDDNETNRHLLVQLTRRWEMDTTAAGSADEALLCLRDAAARHEPFQCAALDMHMPGTNGLQLAEAMYRDETFPTPALLMLTSTYDDRRNAREAGIDVYMTKPVRRSRLRNALAAALGIQTRRERVPTGRDGTAVAGSSPLILVVEDNDLNQILAVRMLGRRGYKSKVVGDGRQALEALDSHPYAAVLMDCQMPELNGYDATSELRRRERRGNHTPVIAMTAHALRGDREKCLASGMDDYVAKPLRPDELDRVLRWWAPRTTDGSGAQANLSRATPNDAPAAEGPLDPAGIELLRSEFGSTGALGTLVDLFGTQTPELLARMRTSVEAGDAGAVKENAHKLKGGCLTMAANRMADLCQGLETIADRGSLEDATAAIDQLDGVFTEVDAALRALAS